MSYQVGFACYADLQSAGDATCSSIPYTSTTLASGNTLAHYCYAGPSVTGTVDGSIMMCSDQYDTTGATVTSECHYSYPVYHPCLYQDFVDAGLIIAAACLGVWVVIWGHQRIIEALHWGRGNE